MDSEIAKTSIKIHLSQVAISYRRIRELLACVGGDSANGREMVTCIGLLGTSAAHLAAAELLFEGLDDYFAFSDPLDDIIQHARSFAGNLLEAHYSDAPLEPALGDYNEFIAAYGASDVSQLRPR